MKTNFIFPNEWTKRITKLAVCLYQRSAWRLAVIIIGIIFAKGRKTITSWLRAAGISQRYKAFYHFIGSIGRKTETAATVLFEMKLKAQTSNRFVTILPILKRST